MTAGQTGHKVQIRVDDLALFYSHLTRALSNFGFNGAQLIEICRAFSVECVRCGIRISSDELERVVLAESTSRLSEPKLERLRAGNCAREGCDSLYVHFCMDSFPGIDWKIAADLAMQAIAAADETAKEQARAAALRRQRANRKRLLIAVMLLGGLFLLNFYSSHRRLPFAQKTSKYQIDPVSVVVITNEFRLHR